MTIEGVDFSWARPAPQDLLNAGKRFVYRYIGVDVGGKSATRAELDEYTGAGLAVILGYEEDGQELLGGYAAGVRIGHAIQAALDDLGYPDAVVLANADFDATEAQQEPINAALDGIASVISLDRTGLYAGYWVIKRAFDAGKITYAMQTYAWSGGNWDPRAQVQQYSNGQQIDGSDVDLDRATAAQFGQLGTIGLASTGSHIPFTIPAAQEDQDMYAIQLNDTDDSGVIVSPGVPPQSRVRSVFVAMCNGYGISAKTLPQWQYDTIIREQWTDAGLLAATIAATVAKSVNPTGIPVDVSALAADVVAAMPKTFTVTSKAGA